MAKELGDLVKMNSPVYRIDQTGDMIVVETLDKQTYKVSAQEDKNDLDDARSSRKVAFLSLNKQQMFVTAVRT